MLEKLFEEGKIVILEPVSVEQARSKILQRSR